MHFRGITNNSFIFCEENENKNKRKISLAEETRLTAGCIDATSGAEH